jgi:hypothetical protein
MLKMLLALLGALVGGILVMLGIGAMLPKSHVVSRAITLRQSPEAVFAVISNFKGFATWRPDVQSVELLPKQGDHVRFRENSTQGAITYEVLEAASPTRLVTRIADPALPFGGSWIFQIAAAPGGCRLNITERGQVYNPLFRFVSRFVLGHTRTLDAYLRNLARHFGESPAMEEGRDDGSS